MLVRHAIVGPCPLFAIDANTRGSGKSLLADVAGTITAGIVMSRKALPNNDEEMRKELGGASAKKCIESKSKEEGSFVEAVPPQNDRALLEERIEARRSARRALRKKNPYKNPGATTSNADVCN